MSLIKINDKTFVSSEDVSCVEYDEGGYRSGPFTIITLKSGRKVLVDETVKEVIDLLYPHPLPNSEREGSES